MTWWRFKAYNTISLYGWGYPEDAEKLCDQLNERRRVNLYTIEPVPNHEVWGLGLEEAPESFTIADELEEGR